MIEYEPSAREITEANLSRSGRRIPDELRVLVAELMVDAAHDGIELGQALAAQPGIPSGLEHYTRGYIDGLTDRIGDKE